MFTSTNISLPNPLVETVPQTIIRKGCFTARRIHLGLYYLPFWRQTLPFLLIGRGLNIHHWIQLYFKRIHHSSLFNRCFLLSRDFVCGTHDIYFKATICLWTVAILISKIQALNVLLKTTQMISLAIWIY